MATCAAAVERGLADPDPWRGFRTVVEEVSVLHALDQGFAEAFKTAFPRAVDVARARERGLRLFALLARRAKEAGALRTDFVLDDLILVLMANRGIRAASPVATAAAARRLAALLIQSFRAQAAGTPLPPSVSLSLSPTPHDGPPRASAPRSHPGGRA
jgi:hypothetical protein